MPSACLIEKGFSVKPKHQGGYVSAHAELCERTLVTLLRALGPWKTCMYLIGGLVPRYLITPPSDAATPPHAGTTDVDIVLDLSLLASIRAYRTLEQNLKRLDFMRGINEEGRAQHHSWRKPIDDVVTIVVDLLCDTGMEHDARIVKLPSERQLSALQIPGAHLAIADHVDVPLTAALLDDRGVVTETIRVANIVPFIVLKALAFQDRLEEKDAYDLVYCLRYYLAGPASVAAAFAHAMETVPNETLFREAVEILRQHFSTDGHIPGYRKDGPTHYARFHADPGRSDLDARNRRDAAATVDAFLRHLSLLRAEF